MSFDYQKKALELREETVAHRRYFHTNAEVGLEAPKAVAYVMDKLTEYGLKPEKCGHGVTASIGTGGKTLLLRADMDALPMGGGERRALRLSHRRRGPHLRPRFPRGHAAHRGEHAEGERGGAERHRALHVPACGGDL